MRNVATVLDRLERVRQTAPGRWIAKCPAHEDRSPSLSIREGDDGRVLVHDFGGCEIGAVLAAIGLTMTDLFEKPIGRGLERIRSGIPTADRLLIIDHEATVAALIIADVVRDRVADEAQWVRLAQACARIGRARDYGRA
jgi:hypothetical protein